jgi:SAM-dependent methyltransferase
MTNDPMSIKFEGTPGTIPLPVARMREGTSIADLGKWMVLGETFAHMAARIAPVSQPFYVDIGCGCGKMARFLALDRGCRYLGIDVHKAAIDWSNAAFAQHPNFTFVHIDVDSPIANPGGSIDPATIRLPCEDSVADVVLCASLFTHLIEPVFVHYMREIERMLSPVGRALISIHNEPADGRFSGDVPRIDISETCFREIVEASGLIIVERIGFWLGQYVFVVGRPGDPGLSASAVTG